VLPIRCCEKYSGIIFSMMGAAKDPVFGKGKGGMMNTWWGIEFEERELEDLLDSYIRGDAVLALDPLDYPDWAEEPMESLPLGHDEGGR
jgi:hypothetical protein